MWSIITNALGTRRDNKELERLHALVGAITEILTAHVTDGDAAHIARVGVRLRKVLEGETYELNLDKEAQRIRSMPLDQLEQLADGMDKLASEIAHEDIESLVALRLLGGWFRASLIRRHASSERVARKALELEDLYFFHVKRTISFLRGESVET